MKILLADDHTALRRGLIEILSDEFAHTTFGETSTCSETLEAVTREKWDVLVLDIFMPGRGGLDVLREVCRQQPHLPVLVLSTAPEEQMAVRVLRAGAAGYLNKRVAPEELVKAVRKVASGGRYVSPNVAERLATEIENTTKPLHETLSDREMTVLLQLVKGLTINEIADNLSLSPKTVSTYHTRIWDKLKVRTDAAMVRYAVEHGLVADQ
jgi:DNA-binding NarL/FixJ family response regulator